MPRHEVASLALTSPPTTTEADDQRPDWTKTAVAVLIGLTSVVSAVFTWRAASLGAEATFFDRSSNTQEVVNQRFEAAVDLRMRTVDEGYVEYLGLRVPLAQYEREIDRTIEATGEFPDELDRRRFELEQEIQAVVASADVFGAGPVRINVDDEFDRQAREQEVRLETQNRPDAAVLGDPAIPAAEADALRARAQGLTRWTVALVAVIVLLTMAEVARRRRVRLVLGAVSSVGVAAITVLAVVKDFT